MSWLDLRHSLLVGVALSVAGSAACGEGGVPVGGPCGDSGACAGGLQCVAGACAVACGRAVDCGDGFLCDDGRCVEGTASVGDACTREGACEAGLTCALDAEDLDGDGVLAGACASDRNAHAVGALCEADDECRNGVCALGRCVDLCELTVDCPDGMRCVSVPRVELEGAPAFAGCLPNSGSLEWRIPVEGPTNEVAIPMPGHARAFQVVMSVDDQAQLVGATRLIAPDGAVLYVTTLDREVQLAYPMRHAVVRGASVMQQPSVPELPVMPGVYLARIGSFRASGVPGSATPDVRVVAKVDDGAVLDVHFHFLDLTEHACAATSLNAASAAADPEFSAYLGAVRQVLARAGVVLGAVSFNDVGGRPDFDALSRADLRALASAAARPEGLNIFWVRSLDPAGLDAAATTLPLGASQSPRAALALSFELRCQRSWEAIARITAHQIGRALGLSRSLELPDGELPLVVDPIADSDLDRGNLMHFAADGGTDVSRGQRDVMRRSPLLR